MAASHRDPTADRRSKSRLASHRTALALACVAALATVALLAGCHQAVPDVVGKTLDQARTLVEEAGHTLGNVGYDDTSQAATWTVVSQSEGTGAEEGTSVDVVLAGAAPSTIPDMIGGTWADALSRAAVAGVETTIVARVFSDTAAVGTITSQTPVAGVVLPRSIPVNVTISLGPKPPPTSTLRMRIVKTITGGLSPKSVVASQDGHVFAQNMIYTHTVTVYDDRTYKKVKTIRDEVVPADFGFDAYDSPVRGGPVEAAVSADRKYMYVSNYSMYGPGFSRPGDDVGSPGSGVDPSFVYRVRLDTLVIDQLIKVGSVPKFVAVTPDGRYLLVSNWISYSLSVVDTAKGREVEEIRLGAYPRGIAVDPASKYAYVAVMGSSNVAKINLKTFKVAWFKGVGSGPRHVIMSPDGAFLYVTLNGEGRTAKVDVATGKVIKKVATGSQPRSMTMSADGTSLYIVNYESNTVSKVRTSDMKELQEIPVNTHPIGIAYVDATGEIWVACYTGSIIVLREQ